MRKFRIKESADVEGIEGHEVGGTYELYDIDADGDYWLKVDNKHVAWAYSPEDLEEVFEDEQQKPTLHKDTDLGHFTGLVFTKLFDKSVFYIEQHGTSEWMDELIDHSVFVAKQIIERLDKETKND